MINRLLEYHLFTSDTYTLTVGMLLGALLILLFLLLVFRISRSKWRLRLYNKYHVPQAGRRRFEALFRQMGLIVSLFLWLKVLGFDIPFYTSYYEDGSENIVLRYSLFFIALGILVAVRLAEWYVKYILISDKRASIDGFDEEDQRETRSRLTKVVQYIVLFLAALILINNFNLDFKIFHYDYKDKPFDFRFSQILIVILLIYVAQIAVWLVTQIILLGVYRRKQIDRGSQFAINQLLKYIIYTITVIFALKTLGINMTLILGGAAALLVGIGLGLQQTFNDFFSGIVLLFERSVAVGDVLKVGEDVGAVKKIGLRSSIIETRSNVSIIVPNSKLVNDNVSNWTHFTSFGRFDVNVGVAYGSDTTLVKKLLLQAAEEHDQIQNYPRPFVRFTNFGDSSLDFTIFFFSKNFLFIEDVKSDIRFRVDQLFRENNVTIPFPQRDIWIKKED